MRNNCAIKQPIMSTHASDSESFHGTHHSFCPSSFLFFLFIQSIFSILLFLFPFLQYRSPSPSFLYTIFLSLSTLSPLSVSRCLILKLQTESLRNIDPPWLKGQNRVGKKKGKKEKRRMEKTWENRMLTQGFRNNACTRETGKTQ